MDLRADISHAIALWKHRTDEPPPFTHAELVVMALALHDEPMDRKELFLWIYDTFAYWNTRHAGYLWRDLDDDSWRMPWQREGTPLQDLPHGPGLNGAVSDYEVPLQTVNDEALKNETKLRVEPTEAGVYLRYRLWPFERKETFPFLRLPAEVRNTIYDMLLLYPTSGITINRCGTDRSGTVYTQTRDQHAVFTAHLESGRYPWDGPDTLTWKGSHGNRGWRWPVKIGKLSNILALTRVNHQINDEARSVFFAGNTFCFANASHLRSVLRRMPCRDRDCIERIAFRYQCEVVAYLSMREAVRAMASMTSLKWLHISIIAEEWRQEYWYADPSLVDRLQFNKAAAVPDAVEVVLEGQYPEIVEKHIRMDPVHDEPDEESREPGHQEELAALKCRRWVIH